MPVGLRRFFPDNDPDSITQNETMSGQRTAPVPKNGQELSRTLSQVLEVQRKQLNVERTQLKKVSSIRRILMIMLGIFIGLLAMVGLLILFNVVAINLRYDVLIQHLNRARRAGRYTKSAFGTAAALKFPALKGWFGFEQNNVTPQALAIAYYSTGWSQLMEKDPDKEMDYVAELEQLGDQGDASGSFSSAKQLVCEVIGKPNNVPECLDACPGPVGMTSADYANNMIDMALGIGFAASMLIPGWGELMGIVGAAAGLGFGYFTTNQADKQSRSSCGGQNGGACIDDLGNVCDSG